MLPDTLCAIKLASSCPNKRLQENMRVRFLIRSLPCDRQTIIVEGYIRDIRDSDDVGSCHEMIACDIFIKSVIRTSKHVAGLHSPPRGLSSSHVACHVSSGYRHSRKGNTSDE